MSERRYADGYRKLRKADEPRRIAYEVLHEVATQGAFSNIILPKALRQARRDGHFSDRDAAFTSELVHGTLRAIGLLDWVIARHIDRPLGDLDPRALVILRMGAHQLLDMRVPDHAAVSATVDVAREHLTDGPVRFVNAVLRAITREDPAAREAALDAIADEDEALGVRYSHPAWMVAAFREALRAHGYPEDELVDVLAADNEVPTVTLVARPSLMSVDELADEAEDILDTRVALALCLRTRSSSNPATPRVCPRFVMDALAPRMKARSWRPSSLHPHRWRVGLTNVGSTCARAPAVRPRSWLASPPTSEHA